MQENRKGFTILELLLVIVVAGIATVIFFAQKARIDQLARDNQRKVAINAMYYNLEEVFYVKNKHYPETIDETVLTAMDPQLFTDPSDFNIGDGRSNFRYEPTECDMNGKCQHYTLRSHMEAEAEYIKSSRN